MVALAYAAEGAAPRPELRDRILDAAREERPARAHSPRRRWIFPATALAAATAAVAAIGLGLWANSLRDQVERQRVVAFEGGPGRLVLSGNDASLVTCLDPAPDGKTYEAWVIEGKTPRAAGLFRGGCGTLRLTRPVSRGNVVAMTLEDEGGSEAPHGAILMKADV